MELGSCITAADSGAVLSACTATLNVVVQNPCTARRRNRKPHLAIRPENNKTSIEVVVRLVLDFRVQGTSFQFLVRERRSLPRGRSRLFSGH